MLWNLIVMDCFCDIILYYVLYVGMIFVLVVKVVLFFKIDFDLLFEYVDFDVEDDEIFDLFIWLLFNVEELCIKFLLFYEIVIYFVV